MRLYLLQLGSFGVPSFFFMIMVASLVATFFCSYLSRREGGDRVALLDFGIIAIIASVIGSRLFHVFVENPAYYWEKPVRIFYYWQGGFVSIGAFIATVIGWWIYMWRRKLNYLRYMDIAAAGAPIAIFFVRVGCLMAGCCYGRPTDFFFHLIFNDPGSAAGHYHPGIPLHATQIYFMINALLMWGVVLFIYRRRKFYGQVLSVFLMYEGLSRFLLEFLRGDDDRGMWFGGLISTGQISMVAFFIIGAAVWAIGRRSKLDERSE